jgi:hypothetical protein
MIATTTAPAALATGAPADSKTEYWEELRELAGEVAEALGDDLIGVLHGGSYGRPEDCVMLREAAGAACSDVHLFLVTASARPQGMDKLPHLVRRYEHRLRLSIVFNWPLTTAMIDKWPPRLIWQELALGHCVLYGPADILTARVPRHVLEPLPTHEATQLLLNSGAGLIWAARMVNGLETAPDPQTIARLYFNCALSIADALLIGCQRFCTDPMRKQAHLSEMARFEPIVDQSGALLHLRRACEFRSSRQSEYVSSMHSLQEMAQDWQRVFLWIESVRLGVLFQDLEAYAAWPGSRDVQGHSLLQGILANLRLRRLGWVHPRERATRMVAISMSDLAGNVFRFPSMSDAALEQWRLAQ